MFLVWLFLWWVVMTFVGTSIIKGNRLNVDPSTINPHVNYNDVTDMLNGTWEDTNKTVAMEIIYKGMLYAYNIYKQGIRVEPEGYLKPTADYGENSHKYAAHPFFHPVHNFDDGCVQYNWQCMFDIVLVDLDIIKYQEQNRIIAKAVNSKLLAQANH